MTSTQESHDWLVDPRYSTLPFAATLKLTSQLLEEVKAISANATIRFIEDGSAVCTLPCSLLILQVFTIGSQTHELSGRTIRADGPPMLVFTEDHQQNTLVGTGKVKRTFNSTNTSTSPLPSISTTEGEGMTTVRGHMPTYTTSSRPSPTVRPPSKLLVLTQKPSTGDSGRQKPKHGEGFGVLVKRKEKTTEDLRSASDLELLREQKEALEKMKEELRQREKETGKPKEKKEEKEKQNEKPKESGKRPRQDQPPQTTPEKKKTDTERKKIESPEVEKHKDGGRSRNTGEDYNRNKRRRVQEEHDTTPPPASVTTRSRKPHGRGSTLKLKVPNLDDIPGENLAVNDSKEFHLKLQIPAYDWRERMSNLIVARKKLQQNNLEAKDQPHEPATNISDEAASAATKSRQDEDKATNIDFENPPDFSFLDKFDITLLSKIEELPPAPDAPIQSQEDFTQYKELYEKKRVQHSLIWDALSLNQLDFKRLERYWTNSRSNAKDIKMKQFHTETEQKLKETHDTRIHILEAMKMKYQQLYKELSQLRSHLDKYIDEWVS